MEALAIIILLFFIFGIILGIAKLVLWMWIAALTYLGLCAVKEKIDDWTR